MSLPPSPPPECLVDPELAAGILDRVLCGADATPESLEAIRQADRLKEPGSTLAVVSALDFGASAQAGFAATSAVAALHAEARQALEAARAETPEASFKTLEGRADQVLIEEARRTQATLLAVGTHEISRPLGIALGSVATVALHEAPGSVLIARGRSTSEGFPRSIVVGIDGSPQSTVAAALAFRLGERFGVHVWPVAVRSGKDFDIAAVDRIATGVLVEDGHPVETLVAAAAQADLLVVGSRGLHGVRALGSVSERVAHKASCSVLVVRTSTAP